MGWILGYPGRNNGIMAEEVDALVKYWAIEFIKPYHQQYSKSWCLGKQTILEWDLGSSSKTYMQVLHATGYTQFLVPYFPQATTVSNFQHKARNSP